MAQFGNILSSLLLNRNLPLDPEVSILQSLLDLDKRLPSKLLHDQIVIGCSSSDTHRSINVLDGQVLLLEGHGNLSKLNHVHHTGSSKIDRNLALREHKSKNSLYAIINIGERTSLLSISPHLEVFSGSKGLTAERSRSLLAATFPGTTGSVDIMESSNADLHGEITSVSKGHFLGVKLLQSVHILGTGRPGIGLDEARVLGILLFRLVVNTGRRSIEEIGSTCTTGGLKHVHGNSRVVEGEDGFVGADEAHASHISSEVVDVLASYAALDGNVEPTEIFVDEDVAEFIVGHEFVGFPVDNGNVITVLFETLGDVGAYEPCTATDAYLGSVSCWESKFRHCIGII
mmetsp:Transcript_20388/g.30042  ORF Transcript_20388/g.30042 Transcript_20388/m.30042 type:complete len:345 (-) Transcript_20388:295-1329(-)